MLQNKDYQIQRLHDAKVIHKDLISDALKSRLDNLTEDDIDRLIEIADKLDPNRTSSIDIMLLF